MGRMDEYIELFEQSARFFKAEKYAQAIKTLEKAEAADPLTAEFSQIQNAMQRRAYSDAKSIAQGMLQKVSSHPRAIFTLSHLYAIRGAHEERVNILEAGIESSPANLFLRRQLILALEDCGHFAKAIAAAEYLVEIDASFSHLLGLMQIYLRHGFNHELLALSDQAYELCEENAEKRSEIDLLRGQALKILGQRESAISALRMSLENKPSSGAPWWALADMKNYQFSDEDLEDMGKVFRNLNGSPDSRIQAGFSLAKGYELKGELARAIEIYGEANGLHGTRGFNAERFSAAIDSLTQAWTKKSVSIQALHTAASQSSIPIFILGMPRSGSTLVEQILSSHSQIEGTMEMMVLPSVKRLTHVLCEKKLGQSYLRGIGDLSQGDLQSLGKAYMEESAIYRKEGRPYFIDKLPNNFEHIGLIHKILPNAHIIDVRRHPMDCGYSLYKQYFRSGADYSYDLMSIGAYYNGYLKLMDHWNNILPNKFLKVQYEKLIANTDTTIRDMLDFLGVSFEPACLEFYKNKRAVRTASSEQVRQPIYTKSIGSWRQVEKQLAPLQKSLGKATIERF